MCCHWTMCQIIIGQCVQLSLDNVSNNHVNVRQDFFALAIICPKNILYKSHFVQPNVVCPAPAVPAVPTFCTPGCIKRHVLIMCTVNRITVYHTKMVWARSNLSFMTKKGLIKSCLGVNNRAKG